MAYKMHLPLGTGYLRGSVFICHTADGGEGSFHPQKIKLFIVQITIEKALLECENQP